MRQSFLFAAALAAISPSVQAEPGQCGAAGCHVAFRLEASAELGRYGLLIAAPDSGCRKVRYRVEDAAARFLGHTPPLAPGELGMVRIGAGLPRGSHVLTILAEGCAALPTATRRVMLAKRSPDHGWRAAEAERLHLP